MRTPIHRFLALLLSIASVVTIAPLSPAATAQAAPICETNCLRVFAIRSYDHLPGKAAQANVIVTDENVGNIRGAVVQGEWTLPDGTAIARYARIAVRGRAEFPLYSDQYGTATFRVLGITLAGYTFDPDGSALLAVSMDIGEPPVGCEIACASVTAIDMSHHTRAVVGVVFVADETGQVIRDAPVTATWTRPDGRTVTKTATTNRRGKARLRIKKTDIGTYTLTVDQVNAVGMTYDPDHSVTTNSHTVG